MDKIARFLLAAVGVIATDVKEALIDVSRLFEARLSILANGTKVSIRTNAEKSAAPDIVATP